MSSYVNFFVKIGEDFVPLFSYSRSTVIYSFFESYAPYEKVTRYTEETAARIEKELSAYEKRTNDAIEDLKESISTVCTIDANLDEKLEKIAAYKDYIKENREYEKELTFARMFLSVLGDVIWEDDSREVYFGIEVPHDEIEVI